MANYLLDTNHVSPLVTLDHFLRERVIQSMDMGNTFAICVPILTETLFGFGLLPRARQNLIEFERFRPSLICYLPNETDAELAAEFQISLRRKGKQLETVDALIAAVALRYDLTLLTTDGDFRWVPFLRWENWMITASVS
jgi:predicted nucleic acid-binding protein